MRDRSTRPPERTELSAERLRLIQRFMSEKPEGEEDDVSFDPASRALEARPPASPPDVRRARGPKGVPPVAPTFRMPRFGGMAAQPAGVHKLHVAVRAMRSRAELAWPLAAVILALLVGVLIARSA